MFFELLLSQLEKENNANCTCDKEIKFANDEKVREAKEKLKEAGDKLFESLNKLKDKVQEPTLKELEENLDIKYKINIRQWAYQVAQMDISAFYSFLEGAESWDETELNEPEEEGYEIELNPIKRANEICEWILTGNIPE